MGLAKRRGGLTDMTPSTAKLFFLLPNGKQHALGTLLFLALQPVHRSSPFFLAPLSPVHLPCSHAHDLSRFRVQTFECVLHGGLVPPIDRAGGVSLPEGLIDTGGEENVDDQFTRESGEVGVVHLCHVGDEGG